MNEPLTEDKIQYVDYNELFFEEPKHIPTIRVVGVHEIASAVQGLKEDIISDDTCARCGYIKKLDVIKLIDKYYPAVKK